MNTKKTILILLFSIFVLSTTVFFVSRMAPGDPLVSYYGDRVERMSPQERIWAEEKLGLGYYEYSSTMAFVYFLCVLVIIGMVGGLISRKVFYQSE